MSEIEGCLGATTWLLQALSSSSSLLSFQLEQKPLPSHRDILLYLVRDGKNTCAERRCVRYEANVRNNRHN